jgi:hypothetical protein
MASRFQEVYKKTGDKWKATWAALKTIPGLGLILQAVEGVWNGINNIMGGWPAKALEWGKKLIQSFINGIKAMVNSVKNAVLGIANAIKSFLGFGSPPKEGPLRYVIEWGKRLIQSFIDGIKSMAQSVVDAVSGVADAIKNFLGLGSPAKMGPLSELDKWGPGLVETYAQGIRKAVPELKRVAEYAAKQVSLVASPEFAPVIGRIERHQSGVAGFGPAPTKIIQISGPLVNIEGNADEATAELASQLVLRELSKIVGV